MCKQFSSMLCAVFTCPSFSGCVCVEEEGGIFVKSFYKCSILGEADFLMEALIAWSFKRKYLLQELLVIVYTKQCIFPNNCIVHRVSSLYFFSCMSEG